MKRTAMIFSFLMLLGATLPAEVPAERGPEELAQLLGSDTGAYDQFGAALSVSGDRLVVGAPYDKGVGTHHGSAYVFERYTAAREGWEEVTKLRASEASLAELFGSSVAIDGDTIAVGALIDDDAAQGGEAVYVYEQQLNSLKSWNQVARLTPTDEEQALFGAAIALDGDLLAVGAPEDGAAVLAGGAVYLFVREQGAWRPAAKLVAPDAGQYDNFGFSLALDGHRLAVGAPNDDAGNLGSVYLFEGDPTARTWRPAAKLLPRSTETFENFGWSVALDGDLVAVGSPRIDPNGTATGSAYIFERKDTWIQRAHLQPMSSLATRNFGSSIALHGDMVLVGDPSDAEQALGAGAAHVYGRHHGGPDAWGGLYKVRTPRAAQGDRFGQAVSMDDGILAISADLRDATGINSGMAHLFLNKEASATPKLWIPQAVPAVTGAWVDVPIYFDPHGTLISATTFTIDYDEYCLEFNGDDHDGNGIPDGITFHLPPGFSAIAGHDSSDSNGELDIALLDFSLPFQGLPEGQLATLTFRAVCDAPMGHPTLAPVEFSKQITPSFGNTEGASVPGRWLDGSVLILGGERGDCNGDFQVDAGDLPACILEVFDGDGGFWADAAGGGFQGNPIGCDANGDGWIDAGDLSCKLKLIFEGPDSCDSPPDDGRDPSLGPQLEIGQVQGRYLRPIDIPIYFNPGKLEGINTMAFSIYLDPRLGFRTTDKDEDGIPDALSFNTPQRTILSATFVDDPIAPRLDLVIIEPFRPLNRYVREPLMTINVRVRPEPGESKTRIRVGFGDAPFASFGSTGGRSAAGTAIDGEVFVRY